MRARAAAYPLWKRGNEMDQTIAFLGGDTRMRLLAQMMAAEGYDVCSWELSGAPKPLALCDALQASIIVLPLPVEKNGYLICDVTGFFYSDESFEDRIHEQQELFPDYDFEWAFSVYDYVSENLLDLIQPEAA